MKFYCLSKFRNFRMQIVLSRCMGVPVPGVKSHVYKSGVESIEGFQEFNLPFSFASLGVKLLYSSLRFDIMSDRQ